MSSNWCVPLVDIWEGIPLLHVIIRKNLHTIDISSTYQLSTYSFQRSIRMTPKLQQYLLYQGAIHIEDIYGSVIITIASHNLY